MLVSTAVDHPSLCQSGGGEVFKGHDSKHCEMRVCAQKHSNTTQSSYFYVQCVKTALVVQFVKSPMQLCSPSHSFFSASTKLTFTPCNGFGANTAIRSGKLTFLHHMGAHKQITDWRVAVYSNSSANNLQPKAKSRYIQIFLYRYFITTMFILLLTRAFHKLPPSSQHTYTCWNVSHCMTSAPFVMSTRINRKLSFLKIFNFERDIK